jgi:hypothetical protein
MQRTVPSAEACQSDAGSSTVDINDYEVDLARLAASQPPVVSPSDVDEGTCASPASVVSEDVVDINDSAGDAAKLGASVGSFDPMSDHEGSHTSLEPHDYEDERGHHDVIAPHCVDMQLAEVMFDRRYPRWVNILRNTIRLTREQAIQAIVDTSSVPAQYNYSYTFKSCPRCGTGCVSSDRVVQKQIHHGTCRFLLVVRRRTTRRLHACGDDMVGW